MSITEEAGMNPGPAKMQPLSVDDIPNCSVSDQIILQLVTDEDVDLDQLAGAIEESPSATAVIIGLANSAYFSSPKPIYTVIDAIIKVLGMQMVRSIVLSVILGRSLDLSRCPNFSVEAYWTDCLAAARFCQLLVTASELKRFVSVEQIYLCSLLAGFGELVLIHHYPQQMNDLLASRPQADEYIKAQHRLLGTTQAMAGALVGQRWVLPNIVTQTMHYCLDLKYQGENWEVCRVVGDVVRQFGMLRSGETELQFSETTEQILALPSNECGLETLVELQRELAAVAKHLAGRDY